MKTKITIILIASTLLCALFFNTCKKDSCKQPPPVIYNLNATDKSLMVYTGSETIKFSTNTNDTLILMGQGKNGFYSILSGAGYGDCPEADQQYEGYKINFTSGTKNDILSFSQTTAGLSGSTDFNVDIFNNIQNYSSKFHFPLTLTYHGYGDTITLNNITYNDIIHFYPDDSYNSADSLYYSVKFGVIRIKRTNGQFFNLIK
ncbi:MAG: hypothetical protein ACHQK8_03045 [Bacteroidia bacterium]